MIVCMSTYHKYLDIVRYPKTSLEYVYVYYMTGMDPISDWSVLFDYSTSRCAT